MAELREKEAADICRNPWESGFADVNDDYPWLWTQAMSSAGAPKTAREARALPKK